MVSSIHQLFKTGNKGDRIYSVKGGYGKSSFSDDEIQIMIDVLLDLEDYSTVAISRMVRGKDSPWFKAYAGAYSNNIISLDDMRDYFSKRVGKSFIDLYAETRVDPGFVDSDGHYVLPADFYDGDC